MAKGTVYRASSSRGYFGDAMKIRWTAHNVHAVELIAIQLHKDFRAAAKAFGLVSGPGMIFRVHDHGWAACHRQDYFLQRARRQFLDARTKQAKTKRK